MKLYVIFATLCFVNPVVLGRFTYNRNEDLSIEHAKYLGTLKLIEKITKFYNGVNLILMTESGGLLSNILLNDDMFGVTLVDLNGASPEIFRAIKNSHLKTNLPPLYLVVWSLNSTESEVFKVIKRIKNQDYRGLIIIVSSYRRNGKQILLDYPIYDVHIVVPKVYFGEFSMYSKCRFCNNGKDLVTVINTSVEHLGFMEKISPSFKGNFYGSSLTMGIIYYGISKVGTDEQGKEIYTGRVYNYYQILGQLLNVTWKLQDEAWNFDQAFRHIETGNISIFGYEAVYGAEFFNRFDYSTPTIYAEGYSIISIEPLKAMDWSGLLKAFDLGTWLLLLLSLPICGIALHILREGTKERRIGRSFWDILVILLWDSIRVPHPTCGMIILLSVYLHISQLMICLFMGEYTSKIVTPQYISPPINNFEQWLGTDMKWTFCDHQSYLFVKRMLGSEASSRYHNCTTPTGQNTYIFTLKLLTNYPDKLVMFASKAPMKRIIDSSQIGFKKKRKFYFGDPVFLPGHYNIGYSHTAFFKEALSRKIMLILAMGLRSHSYNLMGSIKARFAEADFIEEKLLIEFKHFIIGVYMLAVGYGLAAFALLCEFGYERYKGG